MNYNSYAIFSDSSCTYLEGCIDSLAFNYNENAIISNNTCIYLYAGCTDPTFENYDPLANVDDGSCCNSTGGGIYSQLGQDLLGIQDARFGEAVSLSSNGKILAVGAASENSSNGTKSGVVRIYEEISNNWVQIGGDIIGSAYDWLGKSVALSNDGLTVAIGASQQGSASSNPGYIEIYENISGSWTQIGNTINGTSAGDYFGWSVSINGSGDKVAAGAIQDYNSSGIGYVRVYQENSGSWSQIGQDIVGLSSNDFTGNSISISNDGSKLAVGSPYHDGAGNDAGHARVYEDISGSWVQIGNDLEASAEDWCGYSVSLNNDGSIIIMGCPGNNNKTGSARIYSWDGSNWNIFGSPIDGDNSTDYHGTSVSIDGSGNNVAIGAPFGDLQGYDSDSGSVSMYNWDGINWDFQQIFTIGDESSECGNSVALNSFGNTVAIGAPFHQVNNDDAGKVNVFSLLSSCDAYGCLDSLALNYDSSALISDSSCFYIYFGCTDTLAYNYDSIANTENNSCDYSVYGCTDSLALNYNVLANIDDSSCYICNILNIITIINPSDSISCDGIGIVNSTSTFPITNYVWSDTLGNIVGSSNYIFSLCNNIYLITVTDSLGCSLTDTVVVGDIYGCSDSLALNFNVFVNIDDGSCIYPTIYGCIDSLAYNYDPLANSDDGSCLYCDLTNSFFIIQNTPGNCDGIVIATSNSSNLPITYLWSNGSTNNNLVGLCSGVYSVIILDAVGCTIEDTIFMNVIFGCTDSTALNYNPLATVDDGSCIPCIYGCMDSLACNYDPLATCDDGSCLTVYGCIDSTSFNYDPLATCDDGSCIPFIYGCTDSLALNYNSSANTDDGSCLYCIYGCMDSLACNYDPLATCDDGSCLTIYGCTDSTSFNYDPLATCDDGSCIPFIYGCTDSLALNYNSTANTDDGSCLYCIYGCMDSLACNYNPLATCDDGSCLTVYGCTDSTSFNYDPLATCDDGSCIPFIYGCTDSLALNYNSTANTDDGSCLYCIYGCMDSLACNYNPLATCDDGSCLTLYGCTNSTSFNYDPLATCDDGSCIPFIYGCTDSLALNYNSSANTDDGSCLYCIYGCMDSLACNYDPLATCDDGSCLTLYGCTDSTSFNYDPLATCDDGSCIPFIYGCTDSLALNYNSSANTDDGSCLYCIYGCMDSTALNYDPSATCDDGSCQYPSNCTSPKPTGLYSYDVIDIRAKIGWNNMNDSACMVWKYYVRYREVGTRIHGPQNQQE